VLCAARNAAGKYSTLLADPSASEQITNPPRRRPNTGVRLSLLNTVKTSLRISHLLENLKTANQKVMMYICNYCKHFSPLSIEEYLTYTYTKTWRNYGRRPVILCSAICSHHKCKTSVRRVRVSVACTEYSLAQQRIHAYLHTTRHPDPCSRLATISMGRKIGEGCCAPLGGWSWVPI